MRLWVNSSRVTTIGASNGNIPLFPSSKTLQPHLHTKVPGMPVGLITLFVSQRYQRELNALRRDSSSSEQSIDEIVQSCQEAMEGKGVSTNLPNSSPHNLDG
jgi:hypothetical protein